MEGLVQVLLDRADDKAADGGRVAKAHLRFGGMDVDVDLGRIAFDEQSRDGVAVGGQEIEIGAAQRAGWITPVPGGLGPMTIAMLLNNAVDAANFRAAGNKSTPR